MTAALHQHFRPRRYQRPFMRYLENGGKRAVWVVHRRGGKDLTALNQTCRMAARRRGAYWHIFPTAEQGKKAIWEGFTKDGERIMDLVFPEAIRKRPRAFLPSGEMVVELKNGSIWRLMGSDKMEVVGAGPCGVVFSEFAIAKPKTWDLVRPMLRENDGWAAFITTPRGSNHAKKLFDMAKQDPTWFCELLSLYDTRAYDPEKTIAEERAEGMEEALIRQEYLCDWTAANVGSVWGDLIEALEKAGGIGEFEHERSGLFTTWDLGFTDATSVWVWCLRRTKAGWGLDVVDHYSNHGQPLSHYFDQLAKWTKDRGYVYRKHWLPHDARARTLATGSAIQDQFINRYGTGFVDIGPSLSLLDGIQATRWLLQQDIRIHERCGEGLDALKAYRYAYDDDLKVFTKKPVHDWASHDADAFRGVGCVARAMEEMTRPAPAPEPVRVRNMNSFTLDELRRIQPARKGRI